MSHVDEGTLHAYLDGELPSSERAAVDAHLAQCAPCRGALAEERALLERANALLGSARPVERPVPPFEQLRRVSKRSPWRVRMPYAWAATIVVALGIGYYLRSPEPVSSSFETQRVSLHTPDSIAPYVGTQVVAAVPQSSRSRRAVSRDERREQATEGAASGARADSYVATQQRVLDSGAIAIQRPPAAQLRNASPSAAEPAPSATIILDAAPRAYLNAPVTTQWQVISRGAAASLLGTDPVGLPGLTTRKIQRSPSGDGTVVVEQSLDSATVIQFFQRPAVAWSETDSLAQTGAIALRALTERRKAAAPARADRLARFVGRLRVEISGPLTTDSLNKLLDQVEPLPQH